MAIEAGIGRVPDDARDDRLPGEGFAFLCTHWSAVTVSLGAGGGAGGRLVCGGLVRGGGELRDTGGGRWGMFREPGGVDGRDRRTGRVVLQGQRGAMRGR